MKKFNANRHQLAVTEMEQLDKSQVDKIKEEINFDDRNHYHVAMVKITDRPGEAKNDVSVVVQHFNEQGFEKIKKNFAFLGWNKLIVVHDPSQNPKEETTPIAPVQTTETTSNAGTQMTTEEIEAEIERRANEKALKIVEDSKTNDDDQSNAGTGLDKDQDNDNVPFHFGETVKEMEDFAKANGIDLSGLRKKDEIKAVILTWHNEQQEEANKQ